MVELFPVIVLIVLLALIRGDLFDRLIVLFALIAVWGRRGGGDLFDRLIVLIALVAVWGCLGGVIFLIV